MTLGCRVLYVASSALPEEEEEEEKKLLEGPGKLVYLPLSSQVIDTGGIHGS